jgi:hypothetical protein
MNRLLPTPTPQDIEAALTDICNGTSAIQRWRSDGYFKHHDLWWVTIIFPDGERHSAIGGGSTSAEAAAVAWITGVLPWWRCPDLDEACAKVPRHVPEGFRFEVHARPVRPALKLIQGSRDLLKSDEAIPSLKSALLAERKKSASDEEFLGHLHGLLEEIMPNFSATLTYEE